jgi:hypothetical protein
MGRGGFLERIALMAQSDGYDFAVGLDCGNAGGAVTGFHGGVVIGEWSGMAVLAHEFNHAIVGIDDIYSLDCQAGWDEAYCEYPDGSREYCCYVDGWGHPDGTTELNCAYDDAGEVVCEEQTKECVGDCDCSIYHLEPPSGWTQACYETDASGDYSIPSCDSGCCANVCRGICPGGQVFNGPDGRITHPASEGFWVNRWIPAGEGNNYFMDIPSAGAFPGFWMRLNTSSNHCEGYSFADGMLAMLASPDFRSATDPQTLLVSGTIHRSGVATLHPFYILPEATLDLGPDSAGEYSLVLRGPEGQELGRAAFSVIFAYADPHGGEVDEVPFVHRIAWAEGTTRIELADSAGNVLAAREVSSQAPSVRVLSPNGGETWSQSGQGRIRWGAADPDGDALTYSLSVSSDGGETWLPLAVGLTEPEYAVRVEQLPIGASYMVRVRATDGVNTGDDVSDASFEIRPALALPLPLWTLAAIGILAVAGIGLVGYAAFSALRGTRRR